MESSPFKELVHALAASYQNQQHELPTLHKEQEQEQCCEAMLQSQQEDLVAFQSLLVSAGSPVAAPANFSHVTLTNMGPHDDPEAFALFEHIADMWGWPMEQ